MGKQVRHTKDHPTQQDNSEDRTRLKEETLIASWLSQKKEDTTRRNYAREVRTFFQCFPGLRLKEVEVGHISAFLSKRRHLSQASIKKSKDAISSLLSFCVKVGYIDRNPGLALDRVATPDRTSFRIISEEQVHRLIEYEPDLRNRLVIKTLYMTGLRVGELCGLTWSSFTPRTRGIQLTVVGKGYKTRSILIPFFLYEELLELRQSQSEYHFDLPPAKRPIFCSQKEPYHSIQPNQVRRILKRATERAGLGEPVSPHWLRHCHATHALDRGAPLHILQRTLGHASLSTTGKYLNSAPLDSSSNYITNFDKKATEGHLD